MLLSVAARFELNTGVSLSCAIGTCCFDYCFMLRGTIQKARSVAMVIYEKNTLFADGTLWPSPRDPLLVLLGVPDACGDGVWYRPGKTCRATIEERSIPSGWWKELGKDLGRASGTGPKPL
eukprot:5517081-Prymnesium_polylepis.1